jgi:hypothetical protein
MKRHCHQCGCPLGRTADWCPECNAFAIQPPTPLFTVLCQVAIAVCLASSVVLLAAAAWRTWGAK